MAELDARREELKQAFMRARGFWATDWDPVLELAPEFFAAYTAFSSVPWKTGTLEPRIRELIYVAIDAATTHLHESGLRTHVRNALNHGATKEEIMEVYELTSVLGIHTMTVGVPAMLDVMRELGIEPELPPLTPEQEAAKATFIENRGYWNDLWESLLKLAPEYFRAYSDLSSVPWKSGTLEPKVKEFIYIAIDASTTHLFKPGIRIHIENALRLGATAEEIIEVFQLTSVLGIHTVTVGMPILDEELKRAGR